eukprot:4711012-Amphidinium_carterae.1
MTCKDFDLLWLWLQALLQLVFESINCGFQHSRLRGIKCRGLRRLGRTMKDKDLHASKLTC